MQGEGRQIVFALVAAMLVFIAYQYVINLIFPPSEPPPAATQPVATAPAPTSTSQPTVVEGPAPATTTTQHVEVPAPPSLTTSPESNVDVVGGTVDERITIGGGPDDALRVELTPIGAAIATIELTSRDKDGDYRYRLAPEVDAPYRVLGPVESPDRTHYSYATHRIWIEEIDHEPGWSLSGLAWDIVDQTDQAVTFATELRTTEGTTLVRLLKSYALHEDKPILDLRLAVENASDTLLTVRLSQDAALGIQKEHIQYDMRRLLTAYRSDGAITLAKGYQHSKLQSATRAGEPIQLLTADAGPLAWTVLCNKYFGVYTRPVAPPDGSAEFVIGATGLVANTVTEENPGDLLARLALMPKKVAPGGRAQYPLEIYAGAKDAEHLRQIDPAYAAPTLHYQIAQSADARCCCTFDWLRELMVWLLETIHILVRNYGVAIIILVIIVRGLLHPLTVFQQKSMFKMQESMAKIQPKMQALKEKFKDDRTKQNQEMMKLFGEEGVNPAGNFVAFLPMFIQMPILIALWTSLNTDVNLRHAPFDGWWIVDLSAPDALIRFGQPFDVPVLSGLPLIGRMFSGIPSFNLLPILMGISMWLQQKYMPKPHMQAKLDAARKKHEEARQAGKAASGMSPEDQLRQQQMMAYMMSILFPLMFYYMPAGLNLYWLSTNIFGIGESLLIRRQIDAEKKRRELEGPKPPPKRSGLVTRFLKNVSEQAEALQKKADEMAKDEKKKDKGNGGAPRNGGKNRKR
jgi:YidC/Oxa1 family membrane protein insertase